MKLPQVSVLKDRNLYEIAICHFMGGRSSQLIYHLICQVLVLTVGIIEKLPFAILQGLDLPVDLPLDLPGISSHSRNLYEIAILHFMGGRSAS